MNEIGDATGGAGRKCKACEKPGVFTCKHCKGPVCETHVRQKRGRSGTRFHICNDCYKTDEVLPKLIMVVACAVILVIFITIPLPLERIWMVAVPAMMGVAIAGFLIAILVQDRITRFQPEKGGV